MARRVPHLRTGRRRPQARRLRAEARSCFRRAEDSRRKRRRRFGAVKAPAGDGVRELPRHSGRGRARRSPGAPRRHLRAHLGPRLSPQEATRAAHRADGDEAEAGASAAPGRRRSLPCDRADVRPLAALDRTRPTARTKRRPAPHRGVRLSQLRNGLGRRAGRRHPRPGHTADPRGDGRWGHRPLARHLHQGQEADRGIREPAARPADHARSLARRPATASRPAFRRSSTRGVRPRARS